jgi:hypothetical protein
MRELQALRALQLGVPLSCVCILLTAEGQRATVDVAVMLRMVALCAAGQARTPAGQRVDSAGMPGYGYSTASVRPVTEELCHH